MRYDFEFRSRRSCVMATGGMAATSHPLAVQAALQILRDGGNAFDAAVCAGAAMCVLEPISNGIGGDCFALCYDAASGEVTALNGSGRAARAADPDALLKAGHTRMPRYSGAAVTVPGAVQGWADLLKRHGGMPLADLLQPAIHYAEQGFPVTEWIAAGWAASAPKLRRDPDREGGAHGPPQPSGHELLTDGRAPRVGELMRLPTMAGTLRGIAADGADYIYRGEFAAKAAAHVQAYGGALTAEDFAAHESTWDVPIHTDYRGVRLYECPPNGQGLAALLAVNLARGFDLAAMPEADRVHTLVECMRLAFADARRWIYDPALEPLPLNELCSAEYADERRGRIDPTRAGTDVPHGEPGTDTIYLAVADGAGNGCSFIQSCYMGVGTGLVVPGTGVSLQNRGAGFVLEAGRPNRLAAGKRPYHTIIPALTTRGGALHGVFGVMGGYMQPQGHLQMLVNLLDLGMNPQQALDTPRWMLAGPDDPVGAEQPGGLLNLEEGMDEAVTAELARRGHVIERLDANRRTPFGGGQIILRDADSGVLCAGSDPRKDGCAAGV